MDKEAYWFKHDSNAKDDPKCIVLIEELGLEGYGIFWVLVEMLRAQPDFKAPLRIIPAIARRHNTSTEKVKAVIQRYELFEVEAEEFFYSRSLIDRMQPLIDKRYKLSIAGKKGANKRWNQTKNGVANRVAIGEAYSNKSRVDKIREEKSREKDIQVSPLISDFTNIQKMQEPLTDEQGQKLINEFGKMKVEETLMAMENWKPLVNKNKSAYLTASTWIRRDIKNEPETKILDGGTW